MKLFLYLLICSPSAVLAKTSTLSLFFIFNFLFVIAIGVFCFFLGMKLFPNAKTEIKIVLGFAVAGIGGSFAGGIVKYLLD
jgi:hypothetical protein